MLSEREELVPYLRQRLRQVAARQGERLLSTPANPISMAFTLDTLAAMVAAPKAAATDDASGGAQPLLVKVEGEGDVTWGEGGVSAPEEQQRRAAGEVAEDVAAVTAEKATARRRPPDVTFFGAMLWSR